jgi:hypothetical protein
MIPESARDDFRKKEKAYRDEQAMFRKMEEESGVYELLKKSGKRFFALQIKHLDDKGQPRWWLNPYQQDIHNFGWYSTEDLKLWAADQGPVVMKKKQE